MFYVPAGVDISPDDQLDLGFDINETINLVNLNGSNVNLELDEKFCGFDISLPEINTTGSNCVNSVENQLTSSGAD